MNSNRLLTIAWVAISLTVGTHSFAFANASRHSRGRAFAKNSELFMEQETDNQVETEAKMKGQEFEVKTRNPLRLLVLKLGLTEPRMISPFNYGKYDGVFKCAYCGETLFDSSAKYDSGSGWPSFWRSATKDSIGYKKEFDGRLECRCKRCSSHLGHVFLDGPKPSLVSKQLLGDSPESDPRGRTSENLPRFCVNGASMTFEARGSDEQKS